MTPSTPARPCHDPYACALGQKPCPTPVACNCSPTEADASIAESEKENAARHYGAMSLEAAHALPTGMEPEAWRTRYRSELGMIGHYPWTYTGRKPRQLIAPAYDVEPLYTAAQVLAMQSELDQISAVAACFGDDWPDIPVEPEVLRRVKWAARQLKAAQERSPLTDERISEIDDETHFHEAPDWPVRFARAIEAEARKKVAP